MSTAAPTRPDTDIDVDFESMIANEFDHKIDDSDDPEMFSHYVNKDDIVESAVTGKIVRALCGKRWKPSKNPEKFPVCPDCQRILDEMPPVD